MPVTDAQSYSTFLSTLLPLSPPSQISFLTDTLYPPVFNGCYPWTDYTSLADVTLGDALFLNCGISWLGKAFAGRQRAWAYDFNIPNQTFHGADVMSTFYDAPFPYSFPVYPEVARTHQKFLTNFIKNHDPNIGARVPEFKIYGSQDQMLEYKLDAAGNADFRTMIKDPDVNSRCNWWEKGEYPH
jgi:hypothetical protein